MAGNIIYLPDAEYKTWRNLNLELLREIADTGKVSTAWLNKGNNKEFLIRYFDEMGMTISIGD